MYLNVRYTELRKQIAAMVLLPAVSIILFIFGLLQLKEYGLSETMMDILIFGGTFVVIGGCVLILLRKIIANAVLEYDDKGIFIRIPSSVFLFRSERFIDYMDLKQFSMETDTNGKMFMSLKCRQNHPSILMFPTDNDDTADFEAAGDAIHAIIAKRNATVPSQERISQSGFYDGKGMKILAVALIVAAILLTGLKIYDTEAVPAWRLIAMYVIGIPFILKVFTNSSKYNE